MSYFWLTQSWKWDNLMVSIMFSQSQSSLCSLPKTRIKSVDIIELWQLKKSFIFTYYLLKYWITFFIATTGLMTPKCKLSLSSDFGSRRLLTRPSLLFCIPWSCWPRNQNPKGKSGSFLSNVNVIQCAFLFNKHFESSQKLLKSNNCKSRKKDCFWGANFSNLDKPLTKKLKSVL